MASHAVLAALLIAIWTTFGGGSTESYEHSGSATQTSEPHSAGARVKEHLPNREGRAASETNPSGNIGERNQLLNCQTEGYTCISREVCKNWMFIPFLFGCTGGKVCCEKTEGTSCLRGAKYPGKCVPMHSTDYCISRMPSNDCPLSQVCCRNN